MPIMLAKLRAGKAAKAAKTEDGKWVKTPRTYVPVERPDEAGLVGSTGGFLTGKGAGLVRQRKRAPSRAGDPERELFDQLMDDQDYPDGATPSLGVFGDTGMSDADVNKVINRVVNDTSTPLSASAIRNILAMRGRENLKIDMVDRPDFPPELLSSVITQGTPKLRAAAARKADLTDSDVELLMKTELELLRGTGDAESDKSKSITAGVTQLAKRQDLTDTAKTLMFDIGGGYVRAALLKYQKNIPTETLVAASKDKDPYVRYHAVRNHGFPAELLPGLITDESPYVRTLAARSRDVPPEALGQALQKAVADGDDYLVTTLVANPVTPQESVYAMLAGNFGGKFSPTVARIALSRKTTDKARAITMMMMAGDFKYSRTHGKTFSKDTPQDFALRTVTRDRRLLWGDIRGTKNAKRRKPEAKNAREILFRDLVDPDAWAENGNLTGASFEQYASFLNNLEGVGLEISGDWSGVADMWRAETDYAGIKGQMDGGAPGTGILNRRKSAYGYSPAMAVVSLSPFLSEQAARDLTAYAITKTRSVLRGRGVPGVYGTDMSSKLASVRDVSVNSIVDPRMRRMDGSGKRVGVFMKMGPGDWMSSYDEKNGYVDDALEEKLRFDEKNGYVDDALAEKLRFDGLPYKFLQRDSMREADETAVAEARDFMRDNPMVLETAIADAMNLILTDTRWRTYGPDVPLTASDIVKSAMPDLFRVEIDGTGRTVRGSDGSVKYDSLTGALMDKGVEDMLAENGLLVVNMGSIGNQGGSSYQSLPADYAKTKPSVFGGDVSGTLTEPAEKVRMVMSGGSVLGLDDYGLVDMYSRDGYVEMSPHHSRSDIGHLEAIDWARSAVRRDPRMTSLSRPNFSIRLAEAGGASRETRTKLLVAMYRLEQAQLGHAPQDIMRKGVMPESLLFTAGNDGPDHLPLNEQQAFADRDYLADSVAETLVPAGTLDDTQKAFLARKYPGMKLTEYESPDDFYEQSRRSVKENRQDAKGGDAG